MSQFTPIHRLCQGIATLFHENIHKKASRQRKNEMHLMSIKGGVSRKWLFGADLRLQW